MKGGRSVGGRTLKVMDLQMRNIREYGLFASCYLTLTLTLDRDPTLYGHCAGNRQGARSGHR